jgi:DNA-binding CsgD family transcriptional regulator
LKASRALIKTITKEIHKKLFKSNNATSQIAALSPREKEILLWGADGKTSEEIAIILDLSQDSVNFHHKTIQKKLGTTNRAQAIAHAIAKGYI